MAWKIPHFLRDIYCYVYLHNYMLCVCLVFDKFLNLFCCYATTVKSAWTYNDLISFHCSCMCVSWHRCHSRGVQCILLLTGVSGKITSCACWEGWVSVSVVKENIWESSLLCVITGHRRDAFLHQEAEVSGEPRIQFQGESSRVV